MRISIARALKLKNRLQARIRTVAGDMEHYNSTVAGGTKEVDSREALTEYDRLVTYLITLKAAIFKANMPIYEKILRLAETKAKIKVLRSLNTQHGKIVDTGYRYSGIGDPVEYEANFRKTEIDQLCRALEEQVDQIQEELDGHNHISFIEIDSIEF